MRLRMTIIFVVIRTEFTLIQPDVSDYWCEENKQKITLYYYWKYTICLFALSLQNCVWKSISLILFFLRLLPNVIKPDGEIVSTQLVSESGGERVYQCGTNASNTTIDLLFDFKLDNQLG